MNTIITMLSYPFLQRAFIAGIFISLCASLLGVSLVLKRYSMIGDGLSHVGFGALALANIMNMAPLQVAIPVVILAAFLLLRLSENSKVKADAAIAMVSSVSLALGVILISFNTGVTTDVYNYLFGSILAMSKNDVILSSILSTVVITLFIVFYNKIFAITFDEQFAESAGIHTKFYTMLIAILSAVTIVLGMRMMGSLLISSLIIFPALTSMNICKRFKTVVISSAILSVVSFCIGIYFSYTYTTPAGASIVVINMIFFLCFYVISFIKSHFFRK